MKWKILTAQISEEIRYLLVYQGLFQEEQKGCHRVTRRINDQQYIDQHILKTKRENVAIAWIDHKKVNDISPENFDN